MSYLNLEEDYCSECGMRQIKENLYRSKKDNKLYCIHCIGIIKKEREKKLPISKYEKRKYRGCRNDKKILL